MSASTHSGCYIGCLYQLEPSQLQLILSVVFPVVILARMYESYNIYKKKSTGNIYGNHDNHDNHDNCGNHGNHGNCVKYG